MDRGTDPVATPGRKRVPDRQVTWSETDASAMVSAYFGTNAPGAFTLMNCQQAPVMPPAANCRRENGGAPVTL